MIRLAVSVMVFSATAMCAAADEGPLAAEFVRVAPDHWSFEGAESHARFVPFGANLVLNTKKDLNLFGPGYDPARFERVLVACRGLNVTILKVFLPIGQVLPDPQEAGAVRIAPGYLEHLDDFLDRCQRHGVRAVVAFCGWGGNGCTWWQEGGQYFGRAPWKSDPGIDSIDVLARFWREVAARYRDHPALFAYTPCVEWTLPTVNLTWFPPHGHSSTVPTEPGRWYWRRWLAAKYGDVAALNAAWGTDHASFDATDVPDYGYDHGAHRYKAPEQAIFDYQNFRDWATLRYLAPQIEAIRAADPNHMVTISHHMRFWDLWEGAAHGFLGATPFESKHLVDYVTVHANFHESEAPDRAVADIVRHVETLARFVAAGTPMPVILEEFTFTAADPVRTAEVQRAIVRGTVGHVSGWMTWYLQFPRDPQAGADTTAAGHRSAWLDDALAPTPWGAAARDLYPTLLQGDLARKPPQTTVTLDRRASLVPKGSTVLLRHRRSDDTTPRPIDYVLEHEPDLDLRLEGSGP